MSVTSGARPHSLSTAVIVGREAGEACRAAQRTSGRHTASRSTPLGVGPLQVEVDERRRRVEVEVPAEAPELLGRDPGRSRLPHDPAEAHRGFRADEAELAGVVGDGRRDEEHDAQRADANVPGDRGARTSPRAIHERSVGAAASAQNGMVGIA